MRYRLLPVCFLLATALVACGLVSSGYWPAAVARQKSAESDAKTAEKPAGAEAGIKAITAEYARAFNAADARAAAALWTADGEYDGADDEPIKGRAAIEKSLAAFFKEHPKATATVRVESVRVMARGLATAEGVVVLKLP